MKNITLSQIAYDKIMYYVKKTEFEISGLGIVEVIDGEPIVTDIVLLEQENSSAETEMTSESINKALYEHILSGKEGELKFWWHSHVNMSCFWSGTDMDTIEQLTENGWFIHGVFNKSEEYRMAYSNNDPFPVFVDDIDLLIDSSIGNEEMIKLVEDKEIYLEKLEAKKEEFLELYDEEYSALEKTMTEECDKQFDEKVTTKTYVSHYPKKGKGKKGFTDKYIDAWEDWDTYGHYGYSPYNNWTPDSKKVEFIDRSQEFLKDYGLLVKDYEDFVSEGCTNEDIIEYVEQNIYTVEEMWESFAEDTGIVTKLFT